MKKITFLPVFILIPLIMITGTDHQTAVYTFDPAAVILRQGDHILQFDPHSGLLEYMNTQGFREGLSDSVFNYPNYITEAANDSSLRIDYPDEGLKCMLSFGKNLEISVTFTSTKPQTLYWPKVSILKKGDYLILPKNEGYYIPFSDTVFANNFHGKKIDATVLSLPFWAVEKDPATCMYEMTSTFHNEIRFENQDTTMELTVMHSFTPNAALKEPYGIRIIHLDNPSPIAPALYFRRELEEKNELVTLDAKIESVPLAKRMIGALFGRLIFGPFITKNDIKDGKSIPLAKAMVEDVKNHRGFIYGRWSSLDPEQRSVINRFAKSDQQDGYLQKEFLRVLGAVLNDEGVNDEFAKDMRKNAALLYADYPVYLLPPEKWGSGVSLRMIDALKDAGINRMVLRATGHRFAFNRKEVAKYAFDQGYLFGIYDSYSSIHDPSDYGTDDSWETAQMPGVSYDSVRMIQQDGTWYKGFKSKGGRANPEAIRNFYEKRINENFNEIPYSYYFIDVDAFGEYYDDYSKVHPLTSQEDAALRVDRLKWLRAAKEVPVGSEKGTYLFSNVLDVNEGVTTPLFGFRDRDMRQDKNSLYYLGNYWPPEMIDIAFKEVPVKEKYRHLNFDPRFKIPLWEAVYHDCLISTAHQGVPALKFSNVKTDEALTEMFYQYPPLYNLNYDFFQMNKDRIAHHYEFYSRSQPLTVKFHVTDFAFLTSDRLVQRIQFGNIQLVANYSSANYEFKGHEIPGKTILFINENGTFDYFNPEDF